MWKKNRSERVSTCGKLQAEYLSQINLGEVHKRQMQLAGRGDDVGYPLARTIRSMVQFNASKYGLGCKGTGNQCERGACMKAAIGMFEGGGKERLPRAVT